MTEEGADRIGSVAEEAARLLGLFATSAAEQQLAAAGARVAGDKPPSAACPECGHDPHSPSTDSVCRVCPICRLLNVVKAISPETLEKIADVVDLVSDGLRGFAASHRAGDAAPGPGDSAG
ncbi:MAG: hypothetical protein IPL45_07405 [Actinomycetales bacterium]|nr:hypothetical protein [Actinomycetales bacterium]